MTSRSVMSVDGEEIPGRHSKKDDAWVSSWKQEERKWMKDDMVTYSKCQRQRMRKTWTLPLQFFVREWILTRKKKIGVIAYYWNDCTMMWELKTPGLGMATSMQLQRSRVKQRDIHLRGSMWSRTKKKPREQSSRTVTWQSADFQTKFVRLSNQVGGDATVAWLSNILFSEVLGNWKNFWKKSLNGHATVVGGHATVDRLSNNVFSTFQAIRNFFEKSHWTVTRQWSEVTRPSADCQTTFFGRSNRFGKILKKVAERSRDSGWGHATVGRLSNNVFWTFQAILGEFRKKSLNGHASVVGGHATVGRLSNNVFSDVPIDLGKFWKKSLNGHATVVGGHATVGRLSNNVFWTFQAIWENFEKSRWTVHATVVGGHATIGRLSNNVFGCFKQLENFLK